MGGANGAEKQAREDEWNQIRVHEGH